MRNNGGIRNPFLRDTTTMIRSAEITRKMLPIRAKTAENPYFFHLRHSLEVILLVLAFGWINY
jgi:hypothetical protein